MKDKKIFSLTILILVAVGSLYLLARSPSEAHKQADIVNPQAQQAQFSYATTTISAPNGNIVAQIADTTDEETQGLSDRTDLPEGTGMLFAFDSVTTQYMWMKDMNFPLDMVWLDQNKKVTYIAADVTPQSYMQNPPEIFYSPTPALYVIEIPSGDANRLGITVGKTLSFALSR